MRHQIALRGPGMAGEKAERLDLHVRQVVGTVAQAALLGRTVEMHDGMHALKNVINRTIVILVDLINYISHNG
jgi:hypothetical protein